MRKPWRALSLIDQHHAPQHLSAPQPIPRRPHDNPVASDRIADTLQ